MLWLINYIKSWLKILRTVKKKNWMIVAVISLSKAVQRWTEKCGNVKYGHWPESQRKRERERERESINEVNKCSLVKGVPPMCGLQLLPGCFQRYPFCILSNLMYESHAPDDPSMDSCLDWLQSTTLNYWPLETVFSFFKIKCQLIMLLQIIVLYTIYLDRRVRQCR